MEVSTMLNIKFQVGNKEIDLQKATTKSRKLLGSVLKIIGEKLLDEEQNKTLKQDVEVK